MLYTHQMYQHLHTHEASPKVLGLMAAEVAQEQHLHCNISQNIQGLNQVTTHMLRLIILMHQAQKTTPVSVWQLPIHRLQRTIHWCRLHGLYHPRHRGLTLLPVLPFLKERVDTTAAHIHLDLLEGKPSRLPLTELIAMSVRLRDKAQRGAMALSLKVLQLLQPGLEVNNPRLQRS